MRAASSMLGGMDGRAVHREVHLILNPAAGRSRAASRREDILRFLRERGMVPTWHVTEGPGHAGAIAAGLPAEALAVAVGGDGTVHEVAAACVGTERIVGVLPLGSGNDYVKALGVGTNLGRALEVLARGNVRRVDAGEVNGVCFNNEHGIGFVAEVAEGVARAPRYLGGTGRYMWSVIWLLAGLECYEATLKLDGERVVGANTILVAVALGTTTGARFRLTPEARLDDGLFDVVFSEEVSRTEVLRLIPKALDGTLLGHPKVHFVRTREVEVNLEEAVPAHVDGEILPPARAFHARVLPGALRVVAP